MRHTSYTDLRKNLASMIDAVNDDHTPLLIMRGGGKPSAVLMSYEDFSAFDETRYLLSTPANADMLRKSIAEFESGNVSKRTLAE